jgi:hypothetical protein
VVMQPSDSADYAREIGKAYAGMSDDELYDVGIEYDSLTPEAQALLREEFAKRSLQPPDIPPVVKTEFSDMVTVRSYRDIAEALIAKSVLDSAGIFSYLRDENTVRMIWTWSQQVGGVRIEVRTADMAQAEELLSQPIPPTIQQDGAPEYQQPECPRCHSLDIGYEGLNQKVGVTGIVLLGFPVPFPRNAWKCQSCGARWTNDNAGE